VVERGPEKAGVGGSIPSLATTSKSMIQLSLRRHGHGKRRKPQATKASMRITEAHYAPRVPEGEQLEKKMTAALTEMGAVFTLNTHS